MTLSAFDPARPIAIIGFGVMGAKVAWACARKGIPARAYDTSADQLERSLSLIRGWSEGEERKALDASLTITHDLDEALAGAQLAFENVPEVMELKQRIHGDIGRRLSADAYMGSNTSSMLCKPLAEASGRPERFFNMNFTDPRHQGLVEIMGGSKTAPETIAFALAWESDDEIGTHSSKWSTLSDLRKEREELFAISKTLHIAKYFATRVLEGEIKIRSNASSARHDV